MQRWLLVFLFFVPILAVPVPATAGSDAKVAPHDRFTVSVAAGALSVAGDQAPIASLQIRAQPEGLRVQVVAGVEAYRFVRTSAEGATEIVTVQERSDVLPVTVGLRQDVPLGSRLGLALGGGLDFLTELGVRTRWEEGVGAVATRSRDHALAGYALVGFRVRTGTGAVEVDASWREPLHRGAGWIPARGMAATVGYAFSF